MGSVIAVATLGLCAVAIGSVTVLVRMDLQRTRAAGEVAQAVELLRIGADAAPDVLAARETDQGEVALALPEALKAGRDVSVELTFTVLEIGNALSGIRPADTESATVNIHVQVGGAVAVQRVSLFRASGASSWSVSDAVLTRVHSSL
ncbi:MAG: hypothetical protein AAF328_02310 [Planctomycetota bacterium]